MDVNRTDSKKIAELRLDFVNDSPDAITKLIRDIELSCIKVLCEEMQISKNPISRIRFGFAIPKSVNIQAVFSQKRAYIGDLYADLQSREFRIDLFMAEVGRGKCGEHRIIVFTFSLNEMSLPVSSGGNVHCSSKEESK